MQKTALFLTALAVALAVAALLYLRAAPAQAPASIVPTMPALATTTLTITTSSTHATSSGQATAPSVLVAVEVADTDASRELGLGGRTSLAQGAGMWFVFDTDGPWAFWMKDTLIPLDMIWVAADGTIITIAHNVQPDSYPQAFYPTAPARFVLEVPAGFAAAHDIAEGDVIKQK